MTLDEAGEKVQGGGRIGTSSFAESWLVVPALLGDPLSGIGTWSYWAPEQLAPPFLFTPLPAVNVDSSRHAWCEQAQQPYGFEVELWPCRNFLGIFSEPGATLLGIFLRSTSGRSACSSTSCWLASTPSTRRGRRD